MQRFDDSGYAMLDNDDDDGSIYLPIYLSIYLSIYKPNVVEPGLELFDLSTATASLA